MEESNYPKIVIELPKTKQDARILLGVWLFINMGAAVSLLLFLPVLNVAPILFVLLMAPVGAVVFVQYHLQTTYKEFYRLLWRLALRGTIE